MIQKNLLFFYSTQDISIFVNIHTDTLKKELKKKKKIYERLIEEYILNQWQFRYFEWTIEKIKKLVQLVDPTSFLLRENPPHDYLVHLSDCFNLYSW